MKPHATHITALWGWVIQLFTSISDDKTSTRKLYSSRTGILNIIYVPILTGLALGCNTITDPSELFENYKESVVLINCSYYFQTTLDNGMKFFYNIQDDEVLLYEDEAEAVENAQGGYGTGFFISSRGEIATNRHVVYPDKQEYLVANKIQDAINGVKVKIKQSIIEQENEAAKIADHLEENYVELDRFDRDILRDKYESTRRKILELESSLDQFYFNPDNTKTELKRVSLGITYNDTHVTSNDDFIECVAIKESKVEALDLALIQLKSGKTPSDINQYFHIDDIEPRRVRTNHGVYMIGYNHGISLAKTQHGIKAQFTQGTISQDPDQYRILYSIPSLPGSSGSPVFDLSGELIAINFAGIQNSQSFNLGIPAIALYNLYYDIPNKIPRQSNTSATPNHPSPPNSKDSDLEETESIISVDFTNIIRDFVEAEDRRDFGMIYSFFSPNVNRYYEIISPTYTDLKENYESAWKHAFRSRNEIQSIDEINDYIYDLHTNFFYYDRENKAHQQNSTVRFIFNGHGEIIELYSLNNKSSTSRNLPAPLHMLNKGYETRDITEYSYNLTSKTYTIKSQTSTPALLYLAMDSYYFKRGQDNWKKASWNYSHYDTQINAYVFVDTYEQEIMLDENSTTISWLTNLRDQNVHHEKIVYYPLTPNNSISIGASNIPKGSYSSAKQTSTPAKHKNSEYSGRFLYKTKIKKPEMDLTIHIRSTPRPNGESIYQCPTDASVYVLANPMENYVKVYVNGYTGYISKSFIYIVN